MDSSNQLGQDHVRLYEMFVEKKWEYEDLMSGTSSPIKTEE